MRVCRTHRRFFVADIRRLQGIRFAQSFTKAVGLRFAHYDMRFRIDHVCVRLHLECGIDRSWMAFPVRFPYLMATISSLLTC